MENVEHVIEVFSVASENVSGKERGMPMKTDILVAMIERLKKFEEYVCNSWPAIVLVWAIGIGFWSWWWFG